MSDSKSTKCTEEELREIMSKPEYRDRTVVRVYERPGGFAVMTEDGIEIVASNMFGLDSKLDTAGFPNPRNLFLMEDV